MADYSRVTPTGWSQGDDSADVARVTPTGWEQVDATAAPSGAPTISDLKAASITATTVQATYDYAF